MDMEAWTVDPARLQAVGPFDALCSPRLFPDPFLIFAIHRFNVPLFYTVHLPKMYILVLRDHG